MKSLLIGLSLSLLSSCSLFYEAPDNVIRGQRTAYNGVTVLEENTLKIIDEYEDKCKKLLSYHIHFVCEDKIKDLEQSDYSQEYIDRRSDHYREERDKKLNEAFADVERIANEMRTNVTTNHELVRKMIGAVYNYLSTSPIEVDDIDFWVEKFTKVNNGSS